MSLIRKPHQLETRKNVAGLIYGQPGIGKSTLGLSAPDTLLLDFDGGAQRIRPDHLCDAVQVKSWQNIIDLFANEDLRAYQSFAIDTAGKALDFMAEHLIEKNGKLGQRGGALTQQGYGQRKIMFRTFLNQVRGMGKNLWFVAHDKEEKEGDIKVIRPEIGGSSSGDLIKELDLVGYIEARGQDRTISFDPCEKFYGKNTCGLDPVIKLPDLSKPGAPNNFLTWVCERFAAAGETRAKLAGDYQRLMAEVESKIAQVVGPVEANEFIVWAKSAQHLWDTAFQAKAMLREKAKALGLTWNAGKGLYEMKEEAALA